MEWAKYQEKLGIGYSDESKRRLLSNKLYTFVKYSALTENYSDDDYYRFCLLTGSIYQERTKGCIAIASLFQQNDISISKMISVYVAFVNTQDIDQEDKGELISVLKDFLTDLCIPFEIICDEDGIYVFPRGAEELDSALVSDPLEWLAEYPDARKTYVTALEQYYDGIYIRDVADNLRKSLEAFLQEFLENDKNLETNKNEICKYLGSQKVDPGISGMFQPLINAYKNVNDRIAKHDDKVDKKLLEFLLYQTGIFIRMVIVVKQAEQEETTDAH